MIKVTQITNHYVNNEVQVSLFSDTKTEVTPSATIEGLPENAVIAQGSTVVTASGEVAFMKSTGEWNWV